MLPLHLATKRWNRTRITLFAEPTITLMWGPVKAVLEGAGSYAGSKEVNYTIIPAELKNAVVSTSFDENGALQVGLSYNNIPLEQGKDYTYTTKKNEDGDMLIFIAGSRK